MIKSNVMRNKISTILNCIFSVFGILCFVSAIIGTNIASKYYFSKPIFIFIYFIFYIAITYIFCKTFTKIKNVTIYIFIFCLVSRLICIFLLQVEPFSDFLVYHEMALKIKDGIPLLSDYGGFFPHTIGFSTIVACIYKCFGANAVCIQITNVFLSVCTAYMIYKIANKLFGDKIAVIAIFIYSIFPSMVLYNELIATEMLFTLLVLCMTYFIILEKENILISLSIGILAAAANMVRPCGPIMVIALFLYYSCIKKNTFLKFIRMYGVILLAYGLVTYGVFHLESSLNGYQVANSPFGYNIFIGAGMHTYGVWNQADAEYAGDLLQNAGLSYNDLHKKLFHEGVLRFLSNGIVNTLELFLIKFGIMWGSNTLIVHYLSSGAVFLKFSKLLQLPGLLNGFHLMYMLFLVIGIFSLRRFKKKSFMYIYILVLGIAAQHIIAEVMERYAYASIVLLIPVVSAGIVSLFTKESELFMFKRMREDIHAVLERDPAAKNSFEVFFLNPGIHALLWHRIAHKLYHSKLMFVAKLLSQLTRFFTGIEIHPGAKIGRGVLIDHGMGVVIGETTEVGDGCTIYQNVTLGGTGKDTGKRHPTIGNNVLIGSGAKVLGPFKVGDNSRIAANAVVLSEVPESSTCVGIPARVVVKDNKKVCPSKDWLLDHTHIPDPVAQELCKIIIRVEQLEKKNIEKDKGENL